MDNLVKSLNRLDLICQMPMALEKISTLDHLKDFAHYYFSRFMSNLTHAFGDFTWSEITDVNHRHSEKIKLLIKHPTLSMTGLIFPIPLGMVHSYKDTLAVLTTLLQAIDIDNIEKDLVSISKEMDSGSPEYHFQSKYDKTSFDQATSTVGKQFAKNGPIHSPARYVLASRRDVDVVNTELQRITKEYYPLILKLDPLIKEIEQKHNVSKMSDADRMILSTTLTSTAYRLSILAVVMNHIQDIEHSFVKCLNILLEKIQ